MHYSLQKKHHCTHLKTWDLLDTALGPYLIDGLEKDEKVHYYTDRFETEEELLGALQLSEVQKQKIKKSLKSGQLEIYSAEKVYLVDGFFNVEERLNAAALGIAAIVSQGFKGFRVAAEMGWIEKALNPNISELVTEYELRCNDFFESDFVTCLCIYCDEFLSPDLCFKNLHTHPLAYIIDPLGENVLTNPLMNTDSLNHVDDMQKWVRYLRSLGINWMARVDASAKSQFKRDIYLDLSKYIVGNDFSKKGIPDLFLHVSNMMDQ